MAGKRPRISLDGEWKFQVEGETDTRSIPVPLPWEAAFPELRDKPVTATYSRSVRVPSGWRRSVIRLHVGAADYYSEVSVNGYLVGTHEGGYTPFAFDVQEFLVTGADNVIQIKVIDGAPARLVTGEGDLTPERTALTATRPFPFTEIPHGKQSWYGTVGGIWQSVFLERCPDTYVENVFVRPDVKNGGAAVRVRLENPPLDASGWTLRLVIDPPNGAPAVPLLESPLPAHRQQIANLALLLPNAALWDMDAPNLYAMRIELRKDGQLIDTYETRFGMRSIESRDGNILLNGHPVFLAGALDQDFYPNTIYSPPSTGFLRDQFRKAKEMGLNMLRCHIKTPDPRYLDLCDEMGILVWYEIPNWAVLTKKSAARGREQLEAMLERDYNHACLLILSIMNESWGIDLTEKWQREWLIEMFDYAKSLDPTRLIVDNSACVGNFHVKSDLDDYHVYFAIPDHANKWAAWCDDFAKRPAWTYTRYGDAVRNNKEPLLLSEFGNWGLPKLSLLRKGYGGRDPWWFATGAGAARPEGLEERFLQYRLDRVFGTYDRFAEASQEQQWLSLKFEIESMRNHGPIVGYVITEFTDLHWEANGLLDMCRNPKVFHDRLAPLQAQDLVIPHHERTAFWGGERFRLPVRLSHFSRHDLTGATLQWHVEGFGELSGAIAPGATAAPRIGASVVGDIVFRVPDVPRARDVVLQMRLVDREGKTRSVNYEKFTFFPAAARQIDLRTPAFVYDPIKEMPNAEATLREAGVRLTERLEDGVLCVTSTLDEKVLHFVENGGAALLIATDRDAIPRTTSGLGSVSRDKNGWWGDWCSGFHWFRREGARSGGPFASLPQTRQFDFTFRHIVPRRVLVGWNQETDFEDIWAGTFLGWVRLPATLVGGFRYGSGKVLATTFEMFRHAKSDPVSVVLLGDLLRFTLSKRFAPQKRVEMTRLELSHTLVPTAETKGALWRYVTATPPATWTDPSFDDSGWKSGRSGFGRGLGQVTARTRWREADIYLRLAVDAPETGVTRAHLRYFHDDDFEVFLNGEPLFTRTGFTVDYEDLTLAPDQVALFRPGRNVLCVHCMNASGPQYVDVGITVEPGAAVLPHEPSNTNGYAAATEGANPAATPADVARRAEGALESTGGDSG